MKNLILIFILFFTLNQVSHGQDLNAYRYVVVPLDYKFLKEPNQYQLAELTKFLFEKEGFEAYIEGNIPENLKGIPCQALHANLEEDSGLFVTRLSLSLKDCNNKEIFRTREGKSREKEYGKAFHEALRDAFESITALDYHYEQPEKIVEVTAIPRQPEKSEEVEVQKSVPEAIKENNSVAKEVEVLTDKELHFTRDNNVYYLQKTSSGYNFYQKGMSEPFAALVKSSTGDAFIYSSVTSKGMANFNQQGDLVVELLEAGSGDLQTTIYKKQVQ
ncbi:hypothetical protein LZ575_11950 [Antarcticibacterium sp. 1MA-6-2]|uniref:hypothetical protein n=1 Tax=Antarcticibacterium sp. 1MA-6-2 TaxID=2908210 RepID=UPI001F25C14F|nr:hypothetical protein [Antarcticibacterium sp. 1MA-6-2]UJH89760.1 hypothetical protein LZ575_11950 [Antarcticibacterium sp. 1MA-6-2]